MMWLKIPVVKEHGSWVVFLLSCLSGIIASLTKYPLHDAGENVGKTFMTAGGLALLVNAKRPLTSLLGKNGRRKENFLWFLLFCSVGLALLAPFLQNGLRPFICFSPLLIMYVGCLYIRKEHAFVAEFLGFALLTLSAPIMYFVLTGVVSTRIYLAVLVYFASGILKVRMRVRRDLRGRLSMILYCLITPAIFVALRMSPYLLIPLIDNVLSAVRNGDVNLRTLGNIEMAKGLIFCALLLVFWQEP